MADESMYAAAPKKSGSKVAKKKKKAAPKSKFRPVEEEASTFQHSTQGSTPREELSRSIRKEPSMKKPDNFGQAVDNYMNQPGQNMQGGFDPQQYNPYYDNLMSINNQQQAYIAQQQEQMMRMQYEQEALRRELELQRYKKAEPAPLNKYDVKPRHVASRERERNALNLLDAYEKQLDIETRDPLDAFYSKKSSKPNLRTEVSQASSRGERLTDRGHPKGHRADKGSVSDRNYPNPQPGPYNHMSPYQHPMMPPNPYPQGGGYGFLPPISSPMGMYGGAGANDPTFLLKLLEIVASDKKKDSSGSKLSNMLAQSLEKQNQILQNMTQTLANTESESKISKETEELRHKINKLKLEAKMQTEKFKETDITNKTKDFNSNPQNPFNRMQNINKDPFNL